LKQENRCFKRENQYLKQENRCLYNEILELNEMIDPID